MGEGDEVIVPGYTCVMVSGPIFYAGAKPIYADIDEGTYNILPSEVQVKTTSRTKAILVQHTYGIPAAVQEVAEVARRTNLPAIADCFHTFGGKAGGNLLGTFGAAAFFSSQWNKPFSTGLGGFALVRDEAVAEKVRQQQEQFADPSVASRFMLASQLLLHEMLVYPRTTAFATSAFRWLTHKGLVVGSSGKQEFDVTRPRDYALKPCRVQCRVGRQEIRRIGENLDRRRRATEFYL